MRPRGWFSKDSSRVGGISYWCRECRRPHDAAHAARRRSQQASQRYSGSDVQRLLIAQSSRCARCGTSLSLGYHVDHIIPLSRGGENVAGNLQLLCAICNLKKSNK
jgi:5-methylcytosine-specific restriction endonuclease McrA